MDCSLPGFPVHHQLPELTQTHVHPVSDAIQPSHPLSSPSPPAFNLSQHQCFSKESVLRIRRPKYWSFSFSISPSNEYSGLISFRMDWLDLLLVQGTLKSLLQHHSSKALILQHSAFFIVQFSHPYMTTRKTIVLTKWTFVSKVMSLGWEDPLEKGILGASLVAQLVKNLPAMQETPVRFLGWEDPLEKGKSYPLQYSGLENSMDCIVHGVAKSQTELSNFHFH